MVYTLTGGLNQPSTIPSYASRNLQQQILGDKNYADPQRRKWAKGRRHLRMD